MLHRIILCDYRTFLCHIFHKNSLLVEFTCFHRAVTSYRTFFGVIVVLEDHELRESFKEVTVGSSAEVFDGTESLTNWSTFIVSWNTGHPHFCITEIKKIEVSVSHFWVPYRTHIWNFLLSQFIGEWKIGAHHINWFIAQLQRIVITYTYRLML